MGKTKRKVARRRFEGSPMERHVTKKQCWDCGEWFPEDEVQPDRDDLRRITGYFCEGCI